MTHARLLAAAATLLVGCGGSPKAPTTVPPPPAKPIVAADLEGEWTATDIDGWTYALSVHGEAYVQTITRINGGPCAQKGMLQTYEKAYGSPYVAPPTGMEMESYGGATYGAAPAANTTLALVLTLVTNECNPDYTGAQLVVLAHQYDGEHVTLRSGVGYGGAEESRRYQRSIPTPAPTPK
jgi:hypothetical protein